MTHPLIALGHAVTAVDESAEMLQHVRGAETIRAAIETLDLGGRRFGAVVLASHLINAPSGDLVAAWLGTCRRHVADDGCVLIEQHPPAWFDAVADTAAGSETERGGIIFAMRDVTRPGPGLVRGTVEYRAGEDVWTHTFEARRLSDAGLRQLLAAAGLALDRYLSGDHTWVRAVPVT